MWGGAKNNNNPKQGQTVKYVAKDPPTAKTPTVPKNQPGSVPKPQKAIPIKSNETLRNPAPAEHAEPGTETQTGPLAQTKDISDKLLFTAGYGGFQIDEYIKMLTSNSITLLMDIRISPHSNFAQEYNQAPFKKAVTAAGIEYLHALELGNVFKFGSDDTAGESPYAELIRTGGEVLTRRLRAKLVNTPGRICKKANDCHRKLVSGYLEENYQVKVVHLRKDLVVPVEAKVV